MSIDEEYFMILEQKDQLKQRRKKIQISQEHCREALELAQKRNSKESKFGAMTYDNRRGGLEAHVIGIVPEIAVAMALSGTVDKRIFEDHGDDGIDITTNVGRVGVKTTTYGEDPYLRVEKEHFSNADLYVLCFYNPRVKHNEVEIIGYAKKEEVAKAIQKQFVPNGPINYVLTESELHPIKDLLKHG